MPFYELEIERMVLHTHALFFKMYMSFPFSYFPAIDYTNSKLFT